MEKPQAADSLDLVLATPSVATPRPRPRLAPGFRFHPTDEELVVYYLRRKVRRKAFQVEAIAEVDIYKHEPWELHAFSAVNTTDKEWYFFMAFENKYNKSTEKGYWKTTENDEMVSHKHEIIGMKKTLVYHAGRAPDGRRTNWVMHEYTLVEAELEKAGVEQNDSFMLCKILCKNEMGLPCSGVYGPFEEEDWEDVIMVPCGDNVEHEDSSQDVECPVRLQGFKSKTPTPSLIFDLASSSTTIHDAPPTGLLNFSFSSAQPTPENHAPPPPKLVGGALDSSSLEKSVPPGYLKFIKDLEEERNNLLASVMHSEATISSLLESNEQLVEEIRRLIKNLDF